VNTNISALIAAIEREVVGNETGAAICSDGGVDESVLVMTRTSALHLAVYLLREVESFDLRPDVPHTGDAIKEILWSLPSFDQPCVCSTEIVATRGDLREHLIRYLANDPDIVTALSHDPHFRDVEAQPRSGEHVADGKASPVIS
jgi:hypothetical protein